MNKPAITLAFTLLVFPASAADIQGCYRDGAWLVRKLAELHNEHFEPLPNNEVVSAHDFRLATYASPAGTWTTVAHHGDGSVCVLHSGETLP